MKPSWRVLLAGALGSLVLLGIWARPYTSPTPASAQGVGIYQRSDCTVITAPVTGQTWCFDQTQQALKVWTGSAFATAVLVNTAGPSTTVPRLVMSVEAGTVTTPAAIFNNGGSAGTLVINGGAGNGLAIQDSGGSTLARFPNSGIFLLGTAVAGTAAAGDFVMKNQSVIWFVNPTNNALVQALSVTNGHAGDIVLGNTSTNADLDLFTGGTGDIVLQPAGVVSTNTKGLRVGSISGGALTEKLVIIGNSSHEPPSGFTAYTRFLASAGGGKNWQVGTGLTTAGN